MKTNLHDLWATPVWEIAVNSQQLDLGYITNVYHTNSGGLENIECRFKDTVVQIIRKNIEEYFHSNFQIRLKSSWFHTQRPGEQIPVHNHNYSNLIVVLYLQAAENSGDLVLVDPTGGGNWGWKKQGRFTGLKSISFRPTVGTLLIIPSFILHYIEENKSLSDRVSFVMDVEIEMI